MSFTPSDSAIHTFLVRHAGAPVSFAELRERFSHLPLIVLRFHLARMVEAGLIERLGGNYRIRPRPAR
jgi:predicted transcriptional regulator